jgi:dTDP-4-dehydrorhamnose 3,5-epimerase
MKLKNMKVKISRFNYFLAKDKRGSFAKLLSSINNRKILKKDRIIEINLSINKKKGTIRGMHYQVGKYKEKKIIYCLQGKVYDVAININKNSKQYLKSQINILTPKLQKYIIIPEDYAHGFQTLENNTILLYLHSKAFNRKYEKTLNPLNKDLKINWPIKNIIISQKDKKA